MELFPDGALVRLRSRASDLLLHADEDGVGVSLSPLRASPRTTWEVRRVERHGTAYFVLQSATDGRHYLAISTDSAPPGARGLRAVQVESALLGVAWSARLASDGGTDVLVRHSVYGFLCPLGCAAGVGARQRVNGRSSILARWDVEPAPVAPAPPSPSPATEKARGGADQILRGPPRAPARRSRGRRAQGRAWAPVIDVAGASRGQFWVPLVDAGSTHLGYVAQDAAIRLPDFVPSGDIEARLGGDLSGAGLIVTVAAEDAARLAALDASLWQKLRQRVGPGQRRSASARVAVFIPLRVEGAAGGEPDPEPEPEPEAPAHPMAVQAMMTRLEKLYEGMVTRRNRIRDHADRLRAIDVLARTGRYDSATPVKKAVQDAEEDVVKLVESYNAVKLEADKLACAIAGEGVNPEAPPPVLSENLEDIVTASALRRLRRRQLMKDEKGDLF